MKLKVDFIHVGFPKTGTTWTQDVLFENIEDLAKIGKPYEADEEFASLLNEFSHKDDLQFDHKAFIHRFKALMGKNRDYFSRKSPSVISFELLSGDFYTGQGASRNLARIKTCFEEPKILISIREQSAIIESLYRHYVLGGGSLSIQEFIYHRSSPSVNIFGEQRLLQKFKYDQYIEKCMELFGEENVLVLPFELLLTNRKDFVARIISFLGIPDSRITNNLAQERKRASFSFFGLFIWRIFNQLFSTAYSDSPIFRPYRLIFPKVRKSLFRPLDNWIFRHIVKNRKYVDAKRYFLWERLAIRLSNDHRNEERNVSIKEKIRTAYLDSNRKTMQLTGLALDDLGYSV